MDKLLNKVVEWAEDKGIIDTEWPSLRAQLEKLFEEVMEFEDELLVEDKEKAKMELGDVLVVSIILAEQLGSDAQSCLQMAYDKISKRTGKTVNGVFVKDE